MSFGPERVCQVPVDLARNATTVAMWASPSSSCTGQPLEPITFAIESVDSSGRPRHERALPGRAAPRPWTRSAW